MPRYLSLEWIDELSHRVASDPALQIAGETSTIRVTQVVTGGPEGVVTYHLAADGADVRFGPGPAADEDVRLVNDWDTAVAVATGQLNAQDAFIQGRIRLHGDQTKLFGALPLFTALDTVFSELRPETTYE